MISRGKAGKYFCYGVDEPDKEYVFMVSIGIGAWRLAIRGEYNKTIIILGVTIVNVFL